MSCNKKSGDELLSNTISEINERSVRKKKLMIFGLAESSVDVNTSTQNPEIKEHESQRNSKVHDILNIISGKKFEKARICRLGKYLQTKTRPRVVKVILSSETEAQNCLKLFSLQKKIGKLPPSIAEIHIRAGHTKLQILEFKKAKEEIESRIAKSILFVRYCHSAIKGK